MGKLVFVNECIELLDMNYRVIIAGKPSPHLLTIMVLWNAERKTLIENSTCT
jgi:hypothetical protein